MGHDTLSISEMSPSISDDLVLDTANAHRAVLVTGD